MAASEDQWLVLHRIIINSLKIEQRLVPVFEGQKDKSDIESVNSVRQLRPVPDWHHQRHVQRPRKPPAL